MSKKEIKIESDFEQSRDYVQSLARGLSVLNAFNHDTPQMNLSQVAELTGLSRAAVFGPHFSTPLILSTASPIKAK